MNELGIDFNTYACLGNVTYKPVQTDGNVIINKHINVLKDKFNIVCPEEDHCIPKLFWSAKLHKTPYKSRFIAGARNCTTKKLAIRINMGLKVIKEYFTRYCNTLYQNTGINANWSISSSTEFLETLKCKEVWSMQVHMISLLYTLIWISKKLKSHSLNSLSSFLVIPIRIYALDCLKPNRIFYKVQWLLLSRYRSI